MLCDETRNIFFCERGYHFVVKAGLELAIFVPWPPKCWDSRRVYHHVQRRGYAFKNCAQFSNLPPWREVFVVCYVFFFNSSLLLDSFRCLYRDNSTELFIR